MDLFDWFSVGNNVDRKRVDIIDVDKRLLGIKDKHKGLDGL